MAHLDPVDKELIEEKFKNVNLKIDNNQQALITYLDNYLEKILVQTTKTNGRVSDLEDETRFIRNLTRYPKLAWFAFLGILSAIFARDIISLFKNI